MKTERERGVMARVHGIDTCVGWLRARVLEREPTGNSACGRTDCAVCRHAGSAPDLFAELRDKPIEF